MAQAKTSKTIVKPSSPTKMNKNPSQKQDPLIIQKQI
jgi:hypothetical protein